MTKYWRFFSEAYMREGPRVFIFQQKVPRDGHGPVVIVARDFIGAVAILFARYYRRGRPRVSRGEDNAFFRNYSYRSYPLKEGVILDQNGT
ncbi:MAG: hypothetical protein A2214_01605 [Candidatus Harrisonbacteria bacterium RIFOXYA1_FULL_48_8]|uniref:Uncharacterized protein n=2 Tax=Candidatus Harrisoniibacteriota TaxID=1817905 RepID=A0A1G1ZU47_9BACT|nr:MAG: hypothetical protein A3E64_01135 [Candidatus Harrisonbacteria bacterium RIFCSPHIGHO2_12_FULL_48_16]OGY68092.1 MAG: hypothetical protein A2214_01605 [Candidatus Harrisonbacteria bacterium RIFOXYA1_FULL_48_8]